MDVGTSVVLTCSFEELLNICVGEEEANLILNDVGVVKRTFNAGDTIEVYFPKIAYIGVNYWFEPNMLKVI